MSIADDSERGATTVIAHHVHPGQIERYEQWLTEVIPICQASPGHLDHHVVRPIIGITSTYTVIIRFETREHVQAWMTSKERRRMLDKARPLLRKNDDFYIRSGLDFWFIPEGAHAQIPTRWKQLLITWSAIYPLVLCIPLVVGPVMHASGMPDNLYLRNLLGTGLAVSLMIYIIMPWYTKLVQRWLFS